MHFLSLVSMSNTNEKLKEKFRLRYKIRSMASVCQMFYLISVEVLQLL